ncbi:MAG: hypothetical protein ACRDK1_07895, partial [Solirubrobacterales bacterium]
MAVDRSNGSAEALTATVVGLVAGADARRRMAGVLHDAGLEVGLEADDADGLIGSPGAAQLSAVVVAPSVGSAGPAEIRALRQRLRGVPIVAMIASPDESQCRRAISAGADGAVLDQDLDEALATTV